MAYQPKSYRKFLATSVAAAIVATGAVPAASLAAEVNFKDIEGVKPWAGDAIAYLVEKGAIEGFGNGEFRPNEPLTRGQIAKVLAIALDLDIDKNAKTDFPDAKDHWASSYIKAIQDQLPGVINGFPDGTFRPEDPVTREQLAKIVVEAYDLEKDKNADINFTDIGGWSKDYIETLASLGIVEGVGGGLFNPTGPVTRAQAAVFVHRTEVEEARKKPAAEFHVDSVTAINAYTLTIKGTGLKDLTAEDITVEDNTVSTVTVAEDGKTATVKLKNPLVVDVATKVTVKDASFDVTYKIEVTEVKIAEGQVFDDDTEKQFIQILVNGQAVTAQELITAGYTVEFKATDKRSGGKDVEIFTGDSATSTTGELADDLSEHLEGKASVDYYVTLTLTKGSEVFVTPNTKITIKNLDSAVSSITNGVIRVKSKGKFDSEFDLVSSTLVSGDEAYFRELHVTVGGTKEIVDLTGLDSMYSVTSSDESVISVNKADYTLTAEGPGTATITVTYGGQTYTKTLTVKSEERKIKSAKLNKTRVYVGEEGKAGDKAIGDFKVQILDQYGDPVNATIDEDFTVHSSDKTKAIVDRIEGPSEDGRLEFKVFVKGVDTGTADFTIRNKANTRIGESVRVNVIENVTISRYTLTVDNSISGGDVQKVKDAGGTDATKNNVSTTSTIDTGDKKYVKIDVKAFNSANQELPAPEAGKDFEVTAVSESDSDVLDSDFGENGVYAKDDYLIVKAGSNDGTVSITITDKKNSNVKQTIKLTVTDKGIGVTNVEFKNVPTINYATTLNYEDFLYYTKSGEGRDPRINGLTLSRTYSQAVRLHEGEPDDKVDTLYIDLNGNGVLDYEDDEPVEPIVGYVGMATTGDVYVNGDINTKAVKATEGYDVEEGSDGYVIFRVYNHKDEIVATKSVKVDF